MKFKCNHTGNEYEYLAEFDIKEMLKHPEYTAVIEEEAPVEAKPKKVKGEAP